MALWTGAIQKVNEGFAANDGTGDSIRDAFIKTDNSFAAINNFLNVESTQDFRKANVNVFQSNVGTILALTSTTFSTTTANISYINGLLTLAVAGDITNTGNIVSAGTVNSSNLIVNGTIKAGGLGANLPLNNYNIVGSGNIVTTGTITTGNISVTGIQNTGPTVLTGTLTVQDVAVQGNLTTNSGVNAAGSIIPTANLQYDLGSPTNFFRNVYSQGLVEVNTVVLNNNDNILRLHSNIPNGDVKDVGILGEFNKNSINNYAYFGYQYSSGNFVYKITPTDVTQGSGVVSDGVYGNVQFGSLFLSNATTGNTLTVASGVVAGGNVYAANLIGNLSGNLSAAAATVTTVTTGTINNSGNITAVGTLVAGAVTAPTITGNLVAVTANAATVNANTVSVVGNITANNFTGNLNAANVTVANLSVTGNVVGNLRTANIASAGTVSATAFVGNVIGATANIATLTVGNIAGNLNVGGTVLSGGSVALTVNNFAQYLPSSNITGSSTTVGSAYFYQGIYSIGGGNVTIASGAVTAQGNIYAGSGSGAPFGFYGNLYGLVTNPVQSYITTVGQLGNLAVAGTTGTNILNVNTLNATNATVSGPLSATAGITASSLTVSGNTSVNNLAISGTVTTGTSISTSATSNALSSGNVTVTGNTTSGNVIAGSIYSNGYKFANGAAFVSTTLANTAEITANIASGANAGLSLAATGVSANTYGSATQVPVLTVDTKGRVTNAAVANISGALTFVGDVTGTGTTGGNTTLTLAPSGVVASTYGSATQVPVVSVNAKGLVTNVTLSTISSTLNTAGTTGTGSVSLLNGTLTLAGTNGVTVAASGSTLTISEPQDLRTTATPTFNGLVTTTHTSTSMTAGTYTVAAGGSIVPANDNLINIGGSSSRFATVYATTFSGTSTTAKYADLAEIYASDAEYEPGTVVVFGGDAEITVTNQFADVAVAGAISTDPAYLMNAESAGLPVALRGRIPVRVIGPVYKGDLLVTAGQNPGYATSVGRSREYPLAVFAKAIETDASEGTKVITAVII
jgi:filamentous hemagglutinin